MKLECYNSFFTFFISAGYSKKNKINIYTLKNKSLIMNFNSSESNIIPKFNYRDLMILLVPILIFALYLFVYKPGILTVASYGQLHQIATGHFTTAYPIFHTMLEALCITIFKRPAFIGVIQILIFAVMWMLICKYHRNDLSDSSNEFAVQFALTLIICLIPINAVYSITLSSNVLFSYSIMFLGFLIKIMIDKNGQIDTKLIVLLAVTLAVMSGLNNYGIIIALISFIAIAYYLMKKGASQDKLIKFAGLTILGLLLVGSLNFVYDVRGDELNIHTNDAFDEPVNLAGARDKFFSSANAEPSKGFEKIESWNNGSSKFNLIDSFVNLFRGNLILGGLFDNPITYMIFSVILLALIFVREQFKEMFFVYLPAFSSIVITIATGQNNLYYSLLVFYLIAIIGVSLWFNGNMKIENIRNATPTPTMPKQVQTPQSDYDDGYYPNMTYEVESLTMEDINDMLVDTEMYEEAPVEKIQHREAPSSDLVDEILKEIEMEKQNKD